MSRSIRSLIKDKKGVAALEYSILAGLVVLGVVATLNLTNIQGSMTAIFANLTTALNNAAAGNATGGNTNTNTGGGTNP